MRDRCRVPFGWRLGGFHYENLDCTAVRDWVFKAVADGASVVFTHIDGTMCEPHNVPKVHAFIDAAKEAERMIADGTSREAVGRLVSEPGRKRFWDHWPE